MPLSPGTRLGRYEVVRLLGAGGMGEVYLAKDKRLQREVALKVLPAGTLADESTRKRFGNEAVALSKLTHPNIAIVHDFDTQDGTDFLVMEYLPGETLDARLAAGPLTEKEVARLGMQIAEGLAAAHDKGVVHRDLKPGNLSVAADGHLKILDFGLAKLLPRVGEKSQVETMSQTQGVSGTLPYMAPEQLLSEAVDARTDVFALGAVLYEMATGKRPFHEESSPRLTDAILHQSPITPSAVNPKVSPDLERIILKCLEKEQENRYQSAKEICVDLRRLATSGVSGPVVRAAPRLKRLVWPFAAVIVLIVTGAVGYQLWQPARPTATSPSGKIMLAVLPLENLSGDPEQEYFSDGMTAEIISKLSRIQSLQVTPRRSVAGYKRTEKKLEQIGQELSVRYVLEGSVRKAGNRVRINAELIDTSTGFQLWADDFDGELRDVFAVQEETALKIAEALNLHLSPQEAEAVRRHYTQNTEAYDAFLRGWALIESFHGRTDPPEEKLEAARNHFEQALTFDANYPPALAGLSEVENFYWFLVESTPEHLQRATELARRALILDPQLPEAHVAMGHTLFWGDDVVGAVEELREAVSLDSDMGYAWCYLSGALKYLQPPDLKGAEEAARESIRLQPIYSYSYVNLAGALELQGRYEEAIDALEYALQLNPEFAYACVELGEIHLGQGNYDKALAEFNRARGMEETPYLLAQIGAAYAGRGDKGKSLTELENAVSGGYSDFDHLESSHHFDSLRGDPRFQDLVRRMRSPTE